MGKHGLYLHSAHVVLEPGRWSSLCTLMPKPTKQEEAAGRPWASADTDARLEIGNIHEDRNVYFIFYFNCIPFLRKLLQPAGEGAAPSLPCTSKVIVCIIL